MSKLNELIDTAKREVGICEIPMGSNDVKYNREYWGERSSYADLPWCVVFCWWICRQAEVPFPNTAHCNGVEAFAREQGRWVSAPYEVGDMIIFDYDRDGSRDHIGLVIEVDGNNLITVEGNYGDKVAKVSRSVSEVIGAYRPDYGGEIVPTPVPVPMPEPVDGDLPIIRNGDVGQAVEVAQAILHYVYLMPMRNSIMTNGCPDGEFGLDTEQACVKVLGVPFIDTDGWKKLIGGVG